jgi:hypothetical protein
MALNPDELYRRFGRFLENVPDFSGYEPLSSEQLQWLGRAQALVKESQDAIAMADINLAAKRMLIGPTRAEALKHIMLTLHTQLASAELRAPASMQGAFIPVASTFDAFAAISKLLQTATRDVLVVDPYLDETVLTDFGTVISAGVNLRLLSDAATVRPSLAPAASRWVAQHGTSRPLLVRLAAPKALHDRAIFVDQKGARTITQSLKDFAKRSPAEIVRADDTAALKIAAYEHIWSHANVVV